MKQTIRPISLSEKDISEFLQGLYTELTDTGRQEGEFTISEFAKENQVKYDRAYDLIWKAVKKGVLATRPDKGKIVVGGKGCIVFHRVKA
jgi:hypothetical protein